ncbi:heme-binding protein [Mycobacterium sp. SMC-4]|uniref:heme-binding protein n=1 Tax=Mycobacterium sp. SMC-4 TaxID=2857059 RepID=UPI003D05DC00
MHVRRLLLQRRLQLVLALIRPNSTKERNIVSHRSFARGVVVAAVSCGAVLAGAAAPAHAQPAPAGCTAADLAKVMTGVTNATGDYLFANPPVNDFFTSLKDVPKDQKRQALTSYMDANPQVKADLERIRQPAKDFRDRCGGPVEGG